jgi:hypothetical protein
MHLTTLAARQIEAGNWVIEATSDAGVVHQLAGVFSHKRAATRWMFDHPAKSFMLSKSASTEQSQSSSNRKTSCRFNAQLRVCGARTRGSRRDLLGTQSKAASVGVFDTVISRALPHGREIFRRRGVRCV